MDKKHNDEKNGHDTDENGDFFVFVFVFISHSQLDRVVSSIDKNFLASKETFSMCLLPFQFIVYHFVKNILENINHCT